jgi:hypothetical protein
MRTPIAVLILASFAAFSDQARGDVITTYNVTGTFEDGASLSGTVTIDTTTAVATSMNLQIPSPVLGDLNLDSTPTSYVFSTFHISSSYDVIKILLEPTSGISDFGQLEVAAPGFVWPSGAIPLINSSDEDVAGDSTAYGLFNFTFGIGNEYVSYLTSGELDPINTPEPATLTMLASGLVAFGGFVVSRRRHGSATESSPLC